MGDDGHLSLPQAPSQELPTAPAPSALRLVIAVAVTSFFTGVGSTLAVWAAVRHQSPVVASTAPTSEPAPTVPPSVAAPARTGTSEAPSPEQAVRQALARFREGIGTCVREVIGVLPGTSPAVPVTMKLMKNGIYASVAADYRSPVFACARYRESEPQPFQIQWQRGAAPVDGMGVAWLDDNGDGQPDRAFGFSAKLVKKKEVTFGEIEQQSPMPKLLPPAAR